MFKKKPSGAKKQAMASLMKEAGLNPKKELLLLILADVMLLVAAYFVYSMTKMLIAPLSILLLIAAADYFLLDKASRIKKSNEERLESEFVHIFSYFRIFVENGRPVYNALEDCVRYASIKMGELLNSLLSGIDKDKSIRPYLDFAKHFKSLEIRQVMISVHKMSFEGGSLIYIRQFESVFASLANEKRKFELDKYSDRLGNLNFLPLADSALTMGLIIVAIVVIMGSLTYGI